MQNRSSAQFNMLPTVVKNLLIINGILFLAKIVLGSQEIVDLDRWLSFWHWGSRPDSYFKLHQIFTYMFMHGSLWHLLFNMYALWMFGKELENIWGPKKFLNFYIICGLFSCLFYALMPYLGFGTFNSVMLGASGAVYGILVGFGLMFPNSILMLIFPPIPLKAKYFVIILIGLDVFMGLKNADSGIAHSAHLGGALGGFLLMKFWIQKRF